MIGYNRCVPVRRSVLVMSALLGGLSVPAAAHQSSIKYVDIAVAGGQAMVSFTVAPADLNEAVGLAADAQPTVQEVLRAPQVAADHVARWLSLSTPDGQRCIASTPAAEPDRDGRFVIVRWQAACPAAITPGGAKLALDFREFFAVDSRHEAIVSVHAPGAEVEPTVVRATEPTVVIEVGATPSLTSWIALGIHHIASGLDHVCFVLALLLGVVVVRTERGWRARPVVQALRSTALLVTGFTIAHSATLMLAALGWLQLPARLVETAIALSIVVTAVETVIRPDARWKITIAFGFGLVHGLGFASAVADQLPPTSVVAPLLGFNLGVELGQLAIVGVALPVLCAIARLIGPERYRRIGLPIAAAPLIAGGLWWLFTRMWG
jgi:hypothetical protein